MGLTTKELQLLTTQMDLERSLQESYGAAAKMCREEALKQELKHLAHQHRQNYIQLLNHLQ